jgi:hypothetical protein
MTSNVIEITPQPKSNFGATYLILFVVLVILASTAWGIGFFLSKSGFDAGKLFGSQVTTQNTGREGWTLVEAKEYSLEYPKEWKFEEISSENPSGKLYNEGGQIEFWEDIPKHYKFTKEQQEKQSSAKESVVQIDGRKGKQIEYSFKSGGSFVVIRLPEAENKPLTTFWVTTSDGEFKKSALEIISTYKTIKP